MSKKTRTRRPNNKGDRDFKDHYRMYHPPPGTAVVTRDGAILQADEDGRFLRVVEVPVSRKGLFGPLR
jgi:hypothetical protein